MLTREEEAISGIWRIQVAKLFDVPPDNIDMRSIMECVKRSIRKKISQKSSKIKIDPIGQKEKKMIYTDDLTVQIFNKIFNQEFPFNEWVESLEDKYNRIAK